MRKFFDKYFRYPYDDFKQGIKNLIKWFPIIWKDRNWDHDFIFSILKFKLTTQAESTLKNDIHTRAQYDAEKMRLCVRLIEKIQSGDYDTEYQSYEKSKYDSLSQMDKNKLSGREKLNMMFEIESSNYDLYFDLHKTTYRKVMKSDRFNREDCKQQSIALWMGHCNHERAKELLFKLLTTHIESWWQ